MLLANVLRVMRMAAAPGGTESPPLPANVNPWITTLETLPNWIASALVSCARPAFCAAMVIGAPAVPERLTVTGAS